MLHCSFEALACGRFWEGRHDGKDWLETFEDFRASVAGEFMCCIAAICNTKCDWMEYSTTFGFPTWSHNVHPCVLCNAEKHELHVLEDARIDEVFPFDLKSMITYDRDAARCEVWVAILSAAIHAAFRTCLKTDKSKHETRAHGKPALGLRLLDPPAPVFALGLLHGDSLEPHPKMLEYGEFFQVREFPYMALFWRRSVETSTLHRNPILSDVTGVTFDVLSVDTLHTLYLGVWQRNCMWVFWHLLSSNVWDLVGAQLIR